MQKKIILAPHSVLATPSKPIGKIDKKVKQIIADMKETLLATTNPKGVGLAAPQVGIPLQLFLTKPDGRSKVRVFINPKITDYSKQTTDMKKPDSRFEGCLSIPKIWGVVNRSIKVELEFMDETGKAQKEVFTDFPARIMQHEVDHLNGILFTQRVLEQKSKLYHPVIDEKGEEILEEFTI